MSQEFNLKYDRIHPQAQAAQTETESQAIRSYEAAYGTESQARHLCFVWLEGNRIFLNYSYLIAGEYMPGLDTIVLTFTTHLFVLKGVNLEDLFYNIMNGVQKQIVCAHSRYNLVGEGEEPLVNEISMTKNNL